MVVSSEPEKTLSAQAARARTAPECPARVATQCRPATSQTRTCAIESGCEMQGGLFVDFDVVSTGLL